MREMSLERVWWKLTGPMLRSQRLDKRNFQDFLGGVAVGVDIPQMRPTWQFKNVLPRNVYICGQFTGVEKGDRQCLDVRRSQE